MCIGSSGGKIEVPPPPPPPPKAAAPQEAKYVWSLDTQDKRKRARLAALQKLRSTQPTLGGKSVLGV